MKINDDKKKNGIYPENEDPITEGDADSGESGGESSWGGQTGEIHFRFRDAMSLDPRDDMLPPSEIRRLLAAHKDIHKERVNKQKLTRQEREAMKEGRYHSEAYKNAMAQMGSSSYKAHPISQKAQFSGLIDKQVSTLPSEQVETNPELRDKLENRFVHRQTPRFNPKPRPPGG